MLLQRSRNLGFTLTELLISVGLLSILLVLISQLFGETSTAVSTSVRTSAVLAATRSTSDQMNRDFKQMLGPSSDPNEAGGYIVIINQQIPDVSFPNARNGGEFVQPFIRSDHIAFVTSVPGSKPMTPRNANSYNNDLVPSEYAVVTYGHGKRTERDGLPRTGGDIGAPDAGLDRLATDLILARHSTHFAPPPVTPGPNDLIVATDRHADGPFSTSVVVNPGTYSGSAILAAGLTDVTNRPYFDSVNGFFNQLLDLDNTSQPSDAFYVNTTFVNSRLQVNPAPTDGDFESWRIAQTHGILAPNCSEFIVQFAGDLDNDGDIDTDDNGTPGNPADDFIIWYDAFNGNFNSATAWAGMTKPGNTNVFTAGATVNDPSVFIFRVGDTSPDPSNIGDAGNSRWPMLIRIRYRLHDARGRITSNDPAALVDGIDNDRDGLADAADPERDEDQISGRWFEHIYRVPRPALPTVP